MSGEKCLAICRWSQGSSMGRACWSGRTTARTERPVAGRLVPGERFPPATLRNQAEGRTEWTTRIVESDGRFHVVFLAGDVCVEAQRQRAERLGCFLAGQDSPLTRYAPIPAASTVQFVRTLEKWDCSSQGDQDKDQPAYGQAGGDAARR
ncbi:phenol 2-monooxygenase [Penicillium riverlandense]|uniref:phenol 2-monooxygenase n=1 Tax=Penicillium riverlandense TaxID=1903569 RepID=UPI0025488A49|nr:phenol 2-monooxygenase [Penicillium riverlandense]KAJ5820576.1 phenol 2-monooxygenase [Penicillium riverlandense]